MLLDVMKSSFAAHLNVAFENKTSQKQAVK